MEGIWVIKKDTQKKNRHGNICSSVLPESHQYPLSQPCWDHNLFTTTECVPSRSVSWPCSPLWPQFRAGVAIRSSQLWKNKCTGICHLDTPEWAEGRPNTKRGAQLPQPLTDTAFLDHTEFSSVSVQLLTATQRPFRCWQKEEKLFVTTPINNWSPWKPAA